MESVKNYCTELLEQLEIANNHPEACALFGNIIREAIKFNLPDNAAVIEVSNSVKNGRDFVSRYLPSGVHLPYSRVCLQYRAVEPDAQMPVVVIAWQDPDRECVVVYYAVRDVGRWRVSELGFTVYRDGSIVPGRRPDVPDSVPISVDGIAYYTVQPLLCLLGALACANVTTIDCPPSPASNFKRAKKGKVPFFEYKVLVIGHGRTGASGSKGGTHSSPRVHLRRGHIRRLADKTVWVNSCVVGNKSLGMIHKDYELRAPE